MAMRMARVAITTSWFLRRLRPQRDTRHHMEFMVTNADIARVIELAVAPVFLLTAISGALSVLSTRLGRIIDRGRRLNEMTAAAGCTETADVDEEQRQLAIRARLVNRAIRMCTMSALFVCFVIIGLFLDELYNINMGVVIAALFMIALGCLSYGLLTFLREINKSASIFRFGRHTAFGRKVVTDQTRSNQ